MRNRTLYQSMFVVLLLFFAMPAFAQDDSPTPTLTPTPAGPDFIYSWGAEVFYPEVVRFDVVVDRQLADITTLTLSVLQSGQNAIVIQLNPSDVATFADEFTEFSYVWEIPDDVIFLFDETIEYSWLITTRQDGANGFAGSFLYADPRADWVPYIDPEEHINFLVPDSANLDVDRLWGNLRDIYQLFVANTDRELTFDFAILADSFQLNPCVLDDDGVAQLTEPLSEQTFVCEDSRLETIIATSGFTILRINDYNIEQIRRVLIDQFFAEFYSDLLINDTTPTWFTQGLWEFYRPNSKIGFLGTLQAAGRNNQLYDLSALQSYDPDSQSTENTLRITQSYGMVLYIANQVGLNGLFELASRLNTSDVEGDFATIYEAITEQSLGGLMLNFNNWLYTNVAESDFSLVTIQDPTPLPSEVPTNTPFPSTPTYTPTATATSTPTATVTGVLTATPLATLTATATRRPQEPTNTPRPAGSIVGDPTEQPPTEENTSTDSQLPLIGIGLIGIGIIVLGIAGALMFRSNNK